MSCQIHAPVTLVLVKGPPKISHWGGGVYIKRCRQLLFSSVSVRYNPFAAWTIIIIIIIIIIINIINANRCTTSGSCSVKTQSWRCCWILRLVFGRPMSRLPFSWYCIAIVGIREFSILLACCSQLFWKLWISPIHVPVLVFPELSYPFDGLSLSVPKAISKISLVLMLSENRIK
jgi:hypothetical protein